MMLLRQKIGDWCSVMFYVMAVLLNVVALFGRSSTAAIITKNYWVMVSDRKDVLFKNSCVTNEAINEIVTSTSLFGGSNTIRLRVDGGQNQFVAGHFDGSLDVFETTISLASSALLLPAVALPVLLCPFLHEFIVQLL